MTAMPMNQRLRALAARSPVRDRLVTMLFLTALLHAILILGITFSSGMDGPVTPGMEVLLVTEDLAAVSQNEGAAYLAQRSQKGSGNTRTLPTGTPATRRNARELSRDTALPGDDAALVTSGNSPQIRYLGAIIDNRLARARQRPSEVSDERSGRGDSQELVLRGDPRTGQWISPDTRAAKLAPYLDGWRRKVERLGTLNYPSAARDAKLSGSPVIEVVIRSDGRLQESRVQRSSGHAALDQAALNILRLASPFNPFPPELAADYRVLRFAYQWEFVAGRPTSGSVTAGTDEVSRP